MVASCQGQVGSHLVHHKHVQSFCGTCNRLRITDADGQIKVCLIRGSTELSLRDALRDERISDHDIARLIHHAIKHFRLRGHGTPQAGITDANDNRPMILIGG